MEAAEHGIPSSYSCLLKELYTSSSARARADHYYRPIPRYREGQDRDVLCLDYYSICLSTTSQWCCTIKFWTTARHGPQSEDLCTQTMWQCLLTLSNHYWLASTAIEQWAKSVGNAVCVAKCGIISFTGNLAPRLDNP
ncbi:hypothetical protein BASA81_013403 [Batrachochytrium salamandrivorans]|nr:hypothetical protein BASA81_013403 [Batrachochytrium salamandrivorans]